MLERLIFTMLDFPVLYPEAAILLICTVLVTLVAVMVYPIDKE